MPLFHYTATRKDGTRHEGRMEAPDKAALYRQIRAEGGIVLSAREVRSISLSVSLFESVKDVDTITFARNLASMLRAGLSLARALAVLSRQTKSKALKKAIGELEGDIRKGSPLHEGLKRFPRAFPALMVSMVRAGEESGSLADSLTAVALQLERSYTLKKKVRGAMLYPSIVVAVMVGIGVLMLMYVVPSLSATFGELGVELPKSTQAIISASDALRNHSLVVFGVAFALLLLVYAGARTGPGRLILDRLLLLIPIIGGIVKEVNAARTARSLSSLLAAGVGALPALSITKDIVQNVHYKKVLAEAEVLVEKGAPVSEAFAKREDIYPVMFSEMVAVGEETGQLSQMLLSVASFYEEEVEQKTKDMSTVIEPFLMVVIGAGVGFFAISMISPIYSLSSAI